MSGQLLPMVPAVKAIRITNLIPLTEGANSGFTTGLLSFSSRFRLCKLVFLYALLAVSSQPVATLMYGGRESSK